MQATKSRKSDKKQRKKEDTKTQICTCFKFSFISFSLAWKGSKSRAERTWIGTNFGTSQDATTTHNDDPRPVARDVAWDVTRPSSGALWTVAALSPTQRHLQLLWSWPYAKMRVLHFSHTSSIFGFEFPSLPFWKKVRHNNQHLHPSALRLEVQSRGEQVLQNYFQPHISSF